MCGGVEGCRKLLGGVGNASRSVQRYLEVRGVEGVSVVVGGRGLSVGRCPGGSRGVRRCQELLRGVGSYQGCRQMS